MSSKQLFVPSDELPYLPFRSPLNISFEGQIDTNDQTYDVVKTQAKQRGFEPPSKPEVVLYQKMDLPKLPSPPPSPTVSELSEEVQEIELQAVKCQKPLIMQASENRPASCCASIRTSFTQQSISETVAQKEASAPAAWLTRMRKRDEGNHKCHIEFRQHRSNTWT